MAQAGTTNISKAPYPAGPYHEVTIGGYVANGHTAAIIQHYRVPFDCYIREVYYSYTKATIGSAADLDALMLQVEAGDTDLNIVATADASANIVGAAQTLHSDVVNVQIKTGSTIYIGADSASANEAGFFFATLMLEPIYAP